MSKNIYKIAIVAALSILISQPVVAAKPSATQSLISGPIPVNTSSITQTISCNLINQTLFNPLGTNISLCGMGELGGVSCLPATTDKVESGISVQAELVKGPFGKAATMFCMVSYEGKAGELTGTACLSDYVNGAQTCLPLEPGQYPGLKAIPIP